MLTFFASLLGLDGVAQRSGAIKAHLAKLMARSPEAVDLRGLYPSHPSQHPSAPLDPVAASLSSNLQDISYAQISDMLEEVIQETGFYLGK